MSVAAAAITRFLRKPLQIYQAIVSYSSPFDPGQHYWRYCLDLRHSLLWSGLFQLPDPEDQFHLC